MDIYKRRDEYDSFTDYGKYCYRKLLDLYAQFMLDIHNITFAIKIMNCLVEVEGHYSKDNIVKLSYLYALIEDKDDFYDLYIKEDFDDMVSYLLLMVVLLSTVISLRPGKYCRILLAVSSTETISIISGISTAIPQRRLWNCGQPSICVLKRYVPYRISLPGVMRIRRRRSDHEQ